MTLARFTSTACSLALLGVLAACSGDPEPRIADPTSDSTPSTPTTAPTTATSASPSAQTESAKAFIRRWAAITFEIQNTGNTEPLAAISRGCIGCDNLIEAVRTIYAQGGSIQAPKPRVTDIVKIGSKGDVVSFGLLLHTRKSVVLDASGEETTSYPGGISEYVVDIIETPEGWLISRSEEQD